MSKLCRFSVAFVAIALVLTFADLGEAKECHRHATVRPGDTCWSVAQFCGISLDTLYHHNGILGGGSRCNNLQPGWGLCCVHWVGRKRRSIQQAQNATLV